MKKEQLPEGIEELSYEKRLIIALVFALFGILLFIALAMTLPQDASVTPR